MGSLPDRLRAFVSRLDLWPRGARVAAAVSGGSDSVALLCLLHDLAAAGEIVLAGLVHLDHAIRPASSEDAAFCRALAARLGIPAFVEREDVPARARASRRSLEAAGRAARDACFTRAAAALGADHIAVAHTRDDQAETVLLRLLRGSGVRGLRGVLPRRGLVVRPLLECTRAELRAELISRGERWLDDPTNADPFTARNRIRCELLPLLRARFSPAVDATLARTAEAARADEAFLASLAREAFAGAARPVEGGVALDRTAFVSLPEALQRRVARLALETAGEPRSYGLKDTEVVVAACGRADGGVADLPGVRMERSGADVVLLISGPAVPSAEAEPTWLPLDVPGEARLPGGAVVRASHGPWAGANRDGRQVALVDPARLTWPLAVRTRRPGDRLRPSGLGGRKKVQDLLVDRKVPRRERDDVPIVVDGAGRIVWVAGHALDEAFRVTDPSGAVVVLELVPPRA